MLVLVQMVLGFDIFGGVSDVDRVRGVDGGVDCYMDVCVSVVVSLFLVMLVHFAAI